VIKKFFQFKNEKQIMQNSIVVIAEHADGQIRPVTYELLAFAKKLQRATRSIPIRVILLADEVKGLARDIADNTGLDVTAVQIPEMANYNGELYTHALTDLLADMHPSFVCIAHTSQGSDYAPALALKLDAACITMIGEIIEHQGDICFARPLYSGKIIARLKPTSETSILTIQPGIFKADSNTANRSGNVTIKSLSAKNRRSRSLGIKQADTDTAGIGEAKVIVAAGRGVGEKENLEIIHQLAALFSKSAVAGSRIVCDIGWLEYQRQVGVTGTTVSPQLYIACGISGAVQHVMGMRNSEFIVAINKDPSAAIFQTADICIVEDLTAFIPAFIRAYSKDPGP
jgi:electron transfer flavoprotein alpha subunit